jgi:ankyrin repeat protein
MLPPDDEFFGFQRDTPLHMALAMKLSDSTLELLIDDDNKVLLQANKFDTAGVKCNDTPMHLAIKTHRAIGVIKLMMDTDCKVMLCTDSLKDTPLHCALRHSKKAHLKDSVNCEKVLSYLIKKCQTLGPDYFMIKGNGETTPLYFAIALDAPMYAIKMLVQCDVRQILHVINFDDAEDSDFKFMNNDTPLHAEIGGQCRLDVIKLLVNACGEVLQKKSDDGLTPLHFAVKIKRPFHIIEYLVSKDRSVLLVDTKYEWDDDEESDGRTPLVVGIGVSLSVNILKLLVDADLKVFTIRTDDGNYLNPMHYLLKSITCTVAYAITVMEFLVPYCTLVSPDMRLALLRIDCSSPLDIYLKCQPRFPELLNYLIDEDEQVLKITNFDNEYPLLTALKRKMPYEVVSKLLPKKYSLQFLRLANIDPNQATYDGRVFKLLTKHGIIALDSLDRHT